MKTHSSKSCNQLHGRVFLQPKKTLPLPVNTESAEGSTYFSSIQILRGWAALGIILLHVVEMLQQYTGAEGMFCSLAPLWQTGAAGVDLFFIISGFVMVQSTWNRFQVPGSAQRFFIRRCIRIVPLYWFYSGCMLLLILLPFTLKEQIFSLPYTLQSFLFIPALNPATGLDLPLLPQGWTLSYEMYFYLLFTLLLLFPRKFFLPALAFVFAGSVLSGMFIQSPGPIIKVLTSPLLLEFAAGCWLASLVKHKDLPSGWALLLLAGGVLLLALSSLITVGMEYRVIFWGIPALSITGAIVFLEKNGFSFFPDLLLKMGNSSYSTYLSHIFILLAVSTLLKNNMVKSLPNDLIALISIIGCLLTGYISFLFLEQRMSRLLLQRLQ